MKIAIAGATGFVGDELSRFFAARGVDVITITRRATKRTDVSWSPSKGKIESEKLEGMDAVINLAGENISTGRWTSSKKERILSSRVEGTGLLAETIAQRARPPKVFLSASAIGYYGSRSGEALDESSPRGEGFLAEVCGRWENAAAPAVKAGIRTVLMRFGMVISKKGGALAKMAPIFRFGLGGRLGSGRQMMSWIHVEDLCRAIELSIAETGLSGPVNFVAPTPVSNAEFTRIVAASVNRPAIFPVPAFALKLLFGEMAEELLLSSALVQPSKLVNAGFTFSFPSLRAAIER